jgi:hypothetical protein
MKTTFQVTTTRRDIYVYHNEKLYCGILPQFDFKFFFWLDFYSAPLYTLCLIFKPRVVHMVIMFMTIKF